MFKYFKKAEFSCHCGCGANTTSEEFISKLDKAREISGVPFIITSGTRCKERNKSEGGIATSTHLSTQQGSAVDIMVPDSRARYAIINALVSVGFTRIGIADDFVHVDDSPIKVNSVMWTY
jgi:hypothetical protein